jgi:hypothetical protein
LAAAPTGALAGKKLKTSSATTTVGTQENGSATAACKRGTKAVSGGFETEFFGIVPNFPFIPAESSRRSGPRDWTSSGFNNGSAEGDLTAFAYCRPRRLKTNSETITIPVGQFDTATASCPTGTKVFSGGFQAEPIDLMGTTPVLYVSESRRASKRTWEASAHSNGNEEGDLTAYVYCRSGRKLKARQATATISDMSPETSSADFQARCKRRERVVSGGFGSPDDSGEFTPRFLTSKKLGKRGWEVEAFLGSMGGTIEVTAHAYCERK